jgi:hypothetical protein
MSEPALGTIPIEGFCEPHFGYRGSLGFADVL